MWVMEPNPLCDVEFFYDTIYVETCGLDDLECWESLYGEPEEYQYEFIQLDVVYHPLGYLIRWEIPPS